MKRVNWEEQWALFAENFYEGCAHIDLSSFGSNKILKLKAGPGFGDLSHPTTALMLSLMKNHLRDETLLDIGSGSGILTLAGILLGAKKGIGIEIDPEAIEHAKANAFLNQLENEAFFSLEMPPTKTPLICLMNMIFPEQAGFQPEKINPKAKLWITSGILIEEKKKYLAQTQKWGWTLLEYQEKDQWMGGIFTL